MTHLKTLIGTSELLVTPNPPPPLTRMLCHILNVYFNLNIILNYFGHGCSTCCVLFLEIVAIIIVCVLFYYVSGSFLFCNLWESVYSDL